MTFTRETPDRPPVGGHEAPRARHCITDWGSHYDHDRFEHHADTTWWTRSYRRVGKVHIYSSGKYQRFYVHEEWCYPIEDSEVK